MRWTLVMLAAMSLAGCSDKGGDDSGGAVVGDATAGETVFNDVCTACHGADGLGVDGYSPSLADETNDLSDAEIEDVILNGLGEMPAQSLTAQQVADVIAYLHATFDA